MKMEEFRPAIVYSTALWKDVGKLVMVQSVAMAADIVVVQEFDQFGQTCLLKIIWLFDDGGST
jgi:hypothetical protein